MLLYYEKDNAATLKGFPFRPWIKVPFIIEILILISFSTKFSFVFFTVQIYLVNKNKNLSTK